MKRYDQAATNLNHFFSVVEHTNVRHEVSFSYNYSISSICICFSFLVCPLMKFKALAEKIRDFLPQPSVSASQTVQIEHSNDSTRADDGDGGEGAGETMATLDDNEDLV